MARASHRQDAERNGKISRNGKASRNGKTSRTRSGRPIWRGLLRFSLVSIPVELYPSKVKGGGDIELVWLHNKCHSRIHYQKVCPIHGEVDKDEIVSGYKYSQNKYVVIQPDELTKLRGQSDKALSVEAMIEPKALDELYFTDKSYYVLPDGIAAEKPYQVFYEAMRQ